jgi:probable selenium-dependent hydroxylase accessory protein YqeC
VERSSLDPVTALGLASREHVVLVGAGGKSTLLAALRRELNRDGRRVLAATTTKVLRLQAAGRLILTEDRAWRDRLGRALDAGDAVFLGRTVLRNGKVDGIAPETADEIFASGQADFLIVEGDGAAGRPLKAPGPREPVVPSSATRVVAVAGLEALGKPVNGDTVFRVERFMEITGAQPGEALSMRGVSQLFTRPDGLFRGSPPAARLTAFLNKLDLAPMPGPARELALDILKRGSPRVSGVVLGSALKGGYITLTRNRHHGDSVPDHNRGGG